ncbi:hypothetical protein F5882DRAFT_488338 [Hyaloscypha sp. PMI_1271]|nr:hypothetical protein F5882DRAFT_488338 [Hyaloscypha sp. PMI_1271]
MQPINRLCLLFPVARLAQGVEFSLKEKNPPEQQDILPKSTSVPVEKFRKTLATDNHPQFDREVVVLWVAVWIIKSSCGPAGHLDSIVILECVKTCSGRGKCDTGVGMVVGRIEGWSVVEVSDGWSVGYLNLRFLGFSDLTLLDRRACSSIKIFLRRLIQNISLSNESPSSPPTHHTASAPSTRQPEELPSYAQSTTSFEQALEQIVAIKQVLGQVLDQNQALINIAPEQALDPALDQSQALINIAQRLISTAKDVCSNLTSSGAGGKSSSAGGKHSRTIESMTRIRQPPPEPPAKKRKLWLDDEDVLIIYSQHKRGLSKPSVAIVIRFEAIPQATADAACESLNKEISRKRAEGALEAGEWSSAKLRWTKQTQEVVRIYEDACANLESNSLMLQSLDSNPKGSTK